MIKQTTTVQPANQPNVRVDTRCNAQHPLLFVGCALRQGHPLPHAITDKQYGGPARW